MLERARDKGRGRSRGERSHRGEGLDVGGERGGVVVDAAGNSAEGEGGGPGADEHCGSECGTQCQQRGVGCATYSPHPQPHPSAARTDFSARRR